MKNVTFALPLCVVLAGCPWPRDRQPASRPPMEPLALQQARAYPETITRDFVSLVDFEDVPGGASGRAQAESFSLAGGPGARSGRCKFVMNITRTGIGALEALLPAGAQLVLKIPYVHDFTNYTLLSFALYSEALRDDLRVKLTTDAASWTSHRALVRPGWNNVLIDIRRLKKVPGFDCTAVRTVRLSFADAVGAVTVNLDDFILIDNSRDLSPMPPGIGLRKDGLDYTLRLPAPGRAVRIVQGGDGLWRMPGFQAEVAICARGGKLPAAGEALDLMGPRRVGLVEVLEHNTVRLRLRNTWFFPTRAGEWLSLAIRQVRWEHTFYSDGRCVTQIELNNAGGNQIGSVRIRPPAPAAWNARGTAGELLVGEFAGPVGLWNCLTPPDTSEGRQYRRNYLNAARVDIRLGRKNVYAPGDARRDRFDESQGCYVLAAGANGHCRFTVVPPPEGLLRPVFRILGPWAGLATANSAGLAVRDIVGLADGSVLFVLPGRFARPFAVEVAGALQVGGRRGR